MKTITLNNERTGLIVVAAAGGFVCGYLCSRYVSSKGSVPQINQTVEEHREDDDNVSLMDTPRSMDSSTSMAFQPKSSRFSNPEGSSADHGIANGDSSSGSSVDTKMALVVRLDLSMVRLVTSIMADVEIEGFAPCPHLYKRILSHTPSLQSVGELTKHCCTASIGQYKKLYKIKAPELKQWVRTTPRFPNAPSPSVLNKPREVCRCHVLAVVAGEGRYEEGVLWCGQ